MMRRITGLWALLACGLASGAFAEERPTAVVYQNGKGGYPNYRIPAIVQAANGDLLAFCEARQGGDASEIDLILKRSIDNGKNWHEKELVQSHEEFRGLYPADTPITVGNPVPIVDHLDPQHPGRIWLPFNVENERVFVIFSDDHGKSWSPPRDITPDVKREGWGWYANGPCHGIQMQHGQYRGRLVVPADHRLGQGGQDKGPNGVQVFFSDDHGQSWKLGAVDDTYEDGLNANETTVCELADGRLYFNTRDQNGDAPGNRGEAFSSDGGETFLPSGDPSYQFFKPSSPVLDPPVVQCSVWHAGNNLILFSGPDESGPSGPGRSDLRIRFSPDGGGTWLDGPLLHTGPAAYSDLVMLNQEQGVFGVLFEAGGPKSTRYDSIFFTTFTLSELQNP